MCLEKKKVKKLLLEYRNKESLTEDERFQFRTLIKTYEALDKIVFQEITVRSPPALNPPKVVRKPKTIIKKNVDMVLVIKEMETNPLFIKMKVKCEVY